MIVGSFDIRPHYKKWDYKGSDPVAKIATDLYKNRQRASRLSPLILMSDPDRVPDIFPVLKKLPEGAALIYRHFGKADRYEEALNLRQITFARQQQFLIGDDPDLAIRVGADGVHFRRDPSLVGPNLWHTRIPDWIITMAGLKGSMVYEADVSVLDGLFVSSVFESQSPSAGQAIGTDSLKDLSQTLSVPIIALGGINMETVLKLKGTGAAGLASVSGFSV